MGEKIDYNSLIKTYKFYLLKKSTKEKGVLSFFFMDIASSFFEVSNQLSGLFYYEFMHFDINIEDLQRIKKLQELNYLLIKVMLYYHGNTLKLVDQSDSFLDKFIIGHEYSICIPSFKFAYGTPLINISQDYLLKLKKIINGKDFEIHQNYYEQLYVQIKLYYYYYKGSYKININYSEHTIHLKGFIDIFLNLIQQFYLYVSLLRKSKIDGMYDLEMDNKICQSFINMRNKLIEEGKIDSKDLSIDNYYEKNFKPLNELNTFLKKEVNFLNSKKNE